MTTSNKVICVMGPTAVGKTALAMALYDHIDAELISVDSALVYRGMDIGTAKPTKQELKQYPHHLIDICDPAEPYSAARFSADASQLIETIHHQGKAAILVGGTMLYFKALLQGFHKLPEADPELRSELEQQGKERGWEAMHQELQKIDPASAERIHPNDSQRIQRAIEVYRISGQTLTELQASLFENELPWDITSIAILPEDREQLRHKIAQRFDLMLNQGFEDEVKTLFQRGDLHTGLPSIRSVGYRQMWQYLEGELDYEEMKFRAITATRQLAKRQMTWLRKWPDLHEIASNDTDLFAKSLKIIE